MIVVALIVFFLFMACFAQQGDDRGPTPAKMGWIGVLLCLLVAVGMPHPGLAILVALAGLNLWRVQVWSERVHQSLYPVCAYGGAYLALTKFMRPELIVPILWGFVGIGSLMGLWSIYALCYYKDGKGFMHHYWFLGRHWITVHEPNRDHGFECAQGNPNHAQAMAALCVAASVGLLGLGQWGVVILLPLILLPIIGIQLRSRGTHPTQGPFHVLNLLIFCLPVLWPSYGWMVAAFYVLGFTGLILVVKPWTKREWWESGRLKHWMMMFRLYWWEQPWSVKVLGTGTASWISVIYKHAVIEFKKNQAMQFLMTSAHNEFLHVGIEHGLVGLFALVWYVSDTLWRVSHAGMEGFALYAMGVTLCSIAAVSFPWTFYHEVYLDEIKSVRGHGSPSLQAASLVIAVLMEAA